MATGFDVEDSVTGLPDVAETPAIDKAFDRVDVGLIEIVTGTLGRSKIAVRA